MDGLGLLKVMGIKPEFEVSCRYENGEVRTVLEGHKVVVEAGIMSIIDATAKADDITVVAKLEHLLSVAKMQEIRQEIVNNKAEAKEESSEPDDCDGDCENCDRHKSMPEGIRKLFDAIFGENKEDAE